MCKVADHENHVRWIYLTTGGRSEVCENRGVPDVIIGTWMLCE